MKCKKYADPGIYPHKNERLRKMWAKYMENFVRQYSNSLLKPEVSIKSIARLQKQILFLVPADVFFPNSLARLENIWIGAHEREQNEEKYYQLAGLSEQAYVTKLVESSEMLKKRSENGWAITLKDLMEVNPMAILMDLF